MGTIGSRIKNRRNELGISQDELAARCGYTSRSTINKIENDCNKLRQDKIMIFAKALETTPEYIMGWESVDDETKHVGSLKQELIRLVDSMTDEQAEALLSWIRAFLNK